MCSLSTARKAALCERGGLLPSSLAYPESGCSTARTEVCDAQSVSVSCLFLRAAARHAMPHADARSREVITRWPVLLSIKIRHLSALGR